MNKNKQRNLLIEKIIELGTETAARQCIKAGSTVMNYEQLTAEINAVAGSLPGQFLKSGEPVGLAFPNNAAFIISLLALGQLGHPCVMLGAGLKPRELNYHIQNSGIKKILAAPHLGKLMQEVRGTSRGKINPSIECWFLSNDNKPAAVVSNCMPAAVVSNSLPVAFLPDDFICQLTSGTNGLSKAAVRTGSAVTCEISEVAEVLRMSEKDTVLVIPPVHHAYGLMGALVTLFSGAKLILMNGFMPADTAGHIEKEHVTIIFAVPFMYRLLSQAAASRTTDFSSLRFCISAGAPLSADTARRFTGLSGKMISQIYGSTETGVITLQTSSDAADSSVGRAIGKRIVKVFDEQGNPLGPGQSGEIRTKSKADARTYLYPASLNAAAFKDGWFIIGDYGHIDEEGRVFVGGRKSRIINVAGMKIDPVEVENEIARIPGIKEVVVIGIDRGSGEQIVKAAIVAESGGITKKEIIDHCMKHLSSFKIPRIIQFLDELPRSQTGKILRKYLE